MAKIEVKGEFDISACQDCSVRDNCRAFKFADGLVTETEPAVNALLERVGKALTGLQFENNEDTRIAAAREFAIAQRRMRGIIDRFSDAQTSTTVIMSRALQAQLEADPGSTNIVTYIDHPDSSSDDTGEILIPETPDIKVEITPEDLDKIGTDLRYYISTGQCGAIEVVEVA